MNKRPDDLVIVNRHIEYDPIPFLQNNHSWHQDGIVMTHFLNAFQSLFPEGERVFIEAVRDCMKRYPSEIAADPVLQDDLQHFIEQESRHSVVHDKWTKGLISSGYETMTAYEQELHNFRTWSRSNLDMMTRLAITIGAEQYTASLAKLFSHDWPELVFHSAPLFQRIFVYHAMEELEHKAVSYDLYRTLHGGYLRRMVGMAFITYYIWYNVLRRHRYLLRRDRAWTYKQQRAFWGFYFGRRGLLRVVVPKILEYMRPSFYPWQNDERAGFEARFSRLRTEFGIEGFQYKGIRTEEPDGVKKTLEKTLVAH